MTAPRFDLALYVVVDPAHCAGRAPEEVAVAAVRGGATLIQYRDKGATTRALVATARRLQSALAGSGVPLLINDRVDVALAAGAAGVHLGQEDMAPEDARRLLGADAILGLTVRRPEEAEAAPLELVDYVSIGGVFATASKENPEPPIGLAGLAALARALRRRGARRLVAIAGIDEARAPGVLAAGVDGIAVISAVCAAPDPASAAARLRALVEEARRKAS